MMKYVSTRGGCSPQRFSDVVLEGLATDGGLYVPDEVPLVVPEKARQWSRLSYRELCFEVMRPFITEEEIPDGDLKHLIAKSYSSFRCPQVTPVVTMEAGPEPIYGLELWHGPTFAFKDVALQFLGPLFDFLLQKRGRVMRVLGATSGDTGSAAIAGLQGKKSVDCVILYPLGRTSRVQELQMTTTGDRNVHCLAVRGTFDDCQTIVKDIFNSPLRDECQLGAVNSINWARILAQMVYYWWAAFRVLEKTAVDSEAEEERGVDFVVPTGNFGNILAGYYARLMGAPIRRLVIASNQNDILTRFRATGEYRLHPVKPSISPSMDITISSNFERLLFHVMGRNAHMIVRKYQDLRTTGCFTVEDAHRDKVQEEFEAFSANEEETKDTIRRLFDTQGDIIDPHTAVGLACAHKYRAKQAAGGQNTHAAPLVVLATAHFGKFVDSIDQLIDREIVFRRVPEELRKLSSLTPKYITVDADASVVSQFLRALPDRRQQATFWSNMWSRAQDAAESLGIDQVDPAHIAAATAAVTIVAAGLTVALSRRN